jgi:hypothetical protein
MVIPGEQDLLDVFDEGFLLRTKKNYSWLSPVSNSKGNIRGRF